jgi:gamma-glutamylcyclotransferase (GGCT)/AIG2-like uncharacterized protein YtfP
MCVIIIKQVGLQVTDATLKKASTINPDGLGIVWLDTFETTYHKSNEYMVLSTDRPYIAHFRYATVGAVGISNTHPFVCGKNTNEYLMMNGTIRGLGNHADCDSKVLAISLGDISRNKWKKKLEEYDSRFVTINVRNRTFQVYNKKLWTVVDGVWYSKDSVAEDTLVAVYGTLRKGESNYWNYLTNSSYIGKGKTAHKYPLVISGLPYLIEEEGIGHHVEVDIFSVTGTVLQRLDMLESHPVWYQRKRVAIDTKQGVKECWIYFNIKTKIKATDVLHKKYEGYSSKYFGNGKDYYGNAKTKNNPTTTPTTIAQREQKSYDEWWDKYPVHIKDAMPPTVDTAFSEVTDAFQSAANVS